MTILVTDIRSALNSGASVYPRREAALAQAKEKARNRGIAAGEAAAKRTTAKVIADMQAAARKGRSGLRPFYPFMGLEATFGRHNADYIEGFKGSFVGTLKDELRTWRGKTHLFLHLSPGSWDTPRNRYILWFG